MGLVLQAGVCGCEEGYTEVMSSDGELDQCTVIPVLEIPTAGDNRADVKTIRAVSPTQPSSSQPGRAGRTWFLQPFSPGTVDTRTIQYCAQHSTTDETTEDSLGFIEWGYYRGHVRESGKWIDMRVNHENMGVNMYSDNINKGIKIWKRGY